MPRLVLEMQLRQGPFVLEMQSCTDAGVLALFGPSGSGKTTALEAIAGLRRPVSGRIEVAGRTLYSSATGIDRPPRARGVGYVPQEALLFPHLDVRRNILYGFRRGARLPLARVLSMLEIESLVDRRVSGLSGGERQRVALARALMSGPSILLLDEPLAAVEIPLRARILDALAAARREMDLPMLYVTHEAREARVIADEVVVLSEGKVVTTGPPGEALADAALDAAPPRDRMTGFGPG
jgi:molybdate transport system ATP-binding protein